MACTWQYQAGVLITGGAERVNLPSLIWELEHWIPLFEQSLVTGMRITEPDRPMTPRGLDRRRNELERAKEALEVARRIQAERLSEEAWLRRQLRGLGDST
jgi:hypothetical protein